MVAPIRQTVTVREDGSIEIRSPELRPGSRAEVVVYQEADPQTSIAEKLAAWERIQKSLNLTEEQARAWIEESREIRQGIGKNIPG
jgi:hypothetical protein